MQISHKTDYLVKNLNGISPALSDATSDNKKRFNDLITTSLNTSEAFSSEDIKTKLYQNAEPENKIPNWVDPDYGYDPNNPRKPNMRELMEAMSGENIEDLYTENNENWQKVRHQASELLYNVVGANEDTRDWPSIMASKNILKTAREQTRAMYQPEVDIQSNYDKNGILIEQLAVIKDSKGNTLRSLSSNIKASEETLLNFGATKGSIPRNLEERINTEKFDDNLLDFLKSFDNSPTSIQKIVVQSASELIANKLSQEIPPDELAKL